MANSIGIFPVGHDEFGMQRGEAPCQASGGAAWRAGHPRPTLVLLRPAAEMAYSLGILSCTVGSHPERNREGARAGYR